jgi:hypothetical protein
MTTGERKPRGEPGHGTAATSGSHADDNHHPMGGWWDCTLRIALVLWVVTAPAEKTGWDETAGLKPAGVGFID